MLSWAISRARQDPASLFERFPKLSAWQQHEVQPTLKQLEQFASATHTPVGYLFLPEPPEERIPIPDFRTMVAQDLARPSPDLLETIYICQQRQEWYRDYALSTGMDPLPFAGTITIGADVVETAAAIRSALQFEIDEQRRTNTWIEALRSFIEHADAHGVMVMVSGVVGSNNRRKLDPKEFRGFALADDLAPLIFINGSDTKSAQMFTLAHELAHIWLGQSAVSDSQAFQVTDHSIERWCNQVAAELLVPLEILKAEIRASLEVKAQTAHLSRLFKVSTLVVLRRLYDAGALSREDFWEEYNLELERLLELFTGSGGDFYRTQPARVSKRFARAILVSTLEGQTLHRDAFRMLGFSKLSTFHELGRRLGVM
jgi:Zn-dependent peptidase ImmA (M78 family)